MTRPSRLAWFAIALYIVAWFLPVISGGHTLADGVLPGWEAVTHAASVSVDGYEDNAFLTALHRSTAWMNLVFVAAIGVFLIRRRTTRLLRYCVWALAVAAVLNTHWLIVMVRDGDLTVLLPGYYAWLASFFLLAFAMWRMSVSDRQR